MVYFNENKQMENFVKSLCIVHKYNYDDIWTGIVHHIDALRREYNEENEEFISLWKYFSDNIESLDEWIEESGLEYESLGQDIQAMYDKKTEEAVHKIVSKIGIISLGGVGSTKELLKLVLSNDSINYKYTFRYESTPYYILETSSEDSTDVSHKDFVALLEKESNKFNPKIFIKTDYIGKALK